MKRGQVVEDAILNLGKLHYQICNMAIDRTTVLPLALCTPQSTKLESLKTLKVASYSLD
jgi:hypothetical protein